MENSPFTDTFMFFIILIPFYTEVIIFQVDKVYL